MSVLCYKYLFVTVAHYNPTHQFQMSFQTLLCFFLFFFSGNQFTYALMKIFFLYLCTLNFNIFIFILNAWDFYIFPSIPDLHIFLIVNNWIFLQQLCPNHTHIHTKIMLNTSLISYGPLNDLLFGHRCIILNYIHFNNIYIHKKKVY